jgi:signal transduction histidine kinase
MSRSSTGGPAGDSLLARAFLWTVVLIVILILALAIYADPEPFFQFELLLWVAVVGAVELLPVPVSRVLQLSLGFPILLGIAILYSPLVAGAVAFVGSFDPREIRRQISVPKSLFNRSQIALSTLAGGAVFHSLASVRSEWPVLIAGALCAAAANYAINVALVTLAMRLLYRVSLKQALDQLRLGALSEFLLNYLGLGFVGVIIAVLFDLVNFWAVAAFILPLVFARQMFFRNMALEEASKELKDREQVMRALSNRMAEERQDERMQIAAYLHDDLAQMLFRLNLQVEMAKKRLAQGDVVAVGRDLDGILGTKQETSDAIRALIRDLHRSPIGRKGLAEAIQSFAEDMTKGHRTTIDTDVIEVSLPPPIQLLIYQIAREAAMNALKHAEADNIWISLQEADGGVRLIIRDDGKGFDTSAPPPEGHFGSVMMRERTLVAKGTFSIESESGSGTTIAATFPPVWVEEGSQLEASGVPGGDGRSGAGQRPPVGSTVGPQRAGVGSAEATSHGSGREERNGRWGEPPVSLGPDGPDRAEPGQGEPEQPVVSSPEPAEEDRSDPPRRRAIPA